MPISVRKTAACPEGGAEQENQISMAPSKTSYDPTNLINGLKMALGLMFLAWMVASGKLNLHHIAGGL
jgi:hypothetical protein